MATSTLRGGALGDPHTHGSKRNRGWDGRKQWSPCETDPNVVAATAFTNSRVVAGWC